MSVSVDEEDFVDTGLAQRYAETRWYQTAAMCKNPPLIVRLVIDFLLFIKTNLN
jgi:hypothetical protein